jgi:hypothetical protein
MIGDKQDQQAGDHSVNIQGREITVGLSYGDARQVAMDVFEANFHRLSRVAAETARTRAEELLDSYIREAASAGLPEIPEAENPDLQYALFTAQREYARSGDKDLGELLVQLLVDRTKQSDRSLIQIVLNESLAVAPKLTADQLDALSLIFLVRYTKHQGLTSLAAFNEYVGKFLLPFATNLPEKDSAYRHLEFASCGTISLGSISISEAMGRTYPGLFSRGFSEEAVTASSLNIAEVRPALIRCLHNHELLQVAALDHDAISGQCEKLQFSDTVCWGLKNLQTANTMGEVEVRKYILEARPDAVPLFERWDATDLKHMTLTSVGIAIAHANIRRRIGEHFDLSIWM